MAEAGAVAVREPAGGGGRIGVLARRQAWALAALVLASAALDSGYALLRLRAFRDSTYDLVIFDQAVRSYSRFGAPVAIVKGVHNGFGPGFSVLGDHFSPILAVLAPLYWIHDGPGTLLVAQGVLFALAIVPVWRFTERRLGAGAAYCAAAAYALSWPVAEALAFDFHEVAFVPLLSAVMIERYDAGRRGRAALAAFLLLLVKEDMGLLLAGFGLYLLTRRGERRAGVVYAAAGVVATAVCSKVAIAAFGGDNDYYWAYTSLGRDLPHAALHVLTHPWDAVAELGSPPAKLAMMGLLVLPLLLLPLASPLTLVVLPALAERMLADRFANWWAPHYHYNAFIVAALVLAAVDGAARLRGNRWLRDRVRRRGRLARALRPGWVPAACLLAAAVVTVPFFAFGDLADPAMYRRNVRASAAAAAVAKVPDGALVEAANGVGPGLTARTRVLLWDWQPRNAPWVVADVLRPTFPFPSVAEQQRRVALLTASGYREVFHRDGYVVLHRPGPDPW
ncbi:DUF2079 domain-containing protein [Actinomadura verrucosospora]|uniref:Membrane protein n=1 Tax=Actinomadura verrucosospora TaxID=46165 RepID=A0A7D3W493_ACTVE|nr:DUF2079 domain-containing protein [Actinomadura verrucosospora]QKG25916.1 membrane protein [Actinomadura verrucosospora]